MPVGTSTVICFSDFDFNISVFLNSANLIKKWKIAMDGKHECDKEAVHNRFNCSLSNGIHDDVRHMTYDDYQNFTLK